jgi:hypothetical protein
MHKRYASVFVAALAVSSLALGSTAWGSTSTVGNLPQVSGTSPFTSCTADDVDHQSGTVYPNSEVEPWIAASGKDRNGDGEKDIIGGYQQDRWSNGASAAFTPASDTRVPGFRCPFPGRRRVLVAATFARPTRG